MPDYEVSIDDPNPRRFNSSNDILSHYKRLAIEHLREVGRLPNHVTLDDFNTLVKEAREFGLSNLNAEGNHLRNALRTALEDTNIGNGTRAVISDISNELNRGVPSMGNRAVRLAEGAWRSIQENSHNGRVLGEFLGDIAKGVGGRMLRSIGSKATLGAAGVAMAGISANASAAEVREMGGTRSEQERAAGAAIGREVVSTFDPSFGIGTGVAFATADRSRDHRLGRGETSAVDQILDRSMRVASSLNNKLFSGNILTQVGSTALNALPFVPVLKAGIVGFAALDRNNSEDVRIAFRNIDRQQENLFDTSTSFPQKIKLHGRDVDTHIALRDPNCYRGMRRYYETHNSNGQFNDELRTLDRFAQLERQRDTMIDRAEARGDINARTADQLQNGTAAQSIRSGFTFAP